MLTVISSLVTWSACSAALPVRHQQAALGVRRPDRDQLHRDGPRRGVRDGNGPWRSFLDGLGNALGYSWILIAVAFFRELFGSGKLFGARVIPAVLYADSGGFYVNNGLMVLAPGAFILLGIIVWVQRAPSGYSEAN